MAITNVDTLPGVVVDVADKNLRIPRPTPGTKVTILATTTSSDISLNEPVGVTDVPAALRRVRHPDGSVSEMSMALAEAVSAGARTIELVKISDVSGEDRTAFVPNARYDALETTLDLLKLHPLDIIVPFSAHADDVLTGTSPGGATRANGFRRMFGDFCFQKTKEFDTTVAVVGVRPLMQVARDESWAGAPTDMTGELFTDPSLSLLNEWPKHLRSEVGTLLDHSSETFLDGHLAGSDEIAQGQLSPSYDGWARDENGSIAIDNNGNNVDGGMFVSITAILARAVNDESQKLANKYLSAESSYQVQSGGAVGYAALISRLQPHEGTTNRPITGYIQSRAMPFGVARDILRARMVTMFSRSGGFVVAKDVTAAHNASDFTRSDYVLLTTVRITHAAIDIVRRRAERFIGKSITRENLASMETEIADGLDNMRGPGAVQDYELSLFASSSAQILGEVSVALILTIGHELLRVNTSIRLGRPEDINL